MAKLKSVEFIPVDDRSFEEYRIDLGKVNIDKYLGKIKVKKGAIVKLVVSGDKPSCSLVSKKIDDYTGILKEKGVVSVIFAFKIEAALVPRAEGVSKVTDFATVLELYLKQMKVDETIFGDILLTGKQVLEKVGG